MEIKLTFTETEAKALEYYALDTQEFLENFGKNSARIAIDEIVDICVKECLANGVQIPGTKEEIVQLAFDQGWVKTAEERNAEATYTVPEA